VGFGSVVAQNPAIDLGPVVAQDPGQVELLGDGNNKLGAMVAHDPGLSAGNTIVATVLDQTLTGTKDFTATIVGFAGTAPDAAHSDAIDDLVGIDSNSTLFAQSYSASTGLLAVTGGSHTASLAFDDFKAMLDFASDGNGGTPITDPPASGWTGAAASEPGGMKFGGDGIGLDPSGTANTELGAVVAHDPGTGLGSVVAHDPGLLAGNTIDASKPLTGTSASDTFVFNFANVGKDTVTDFHPAADALQFGATIFANAQGGLNATHDDGQGNTVAGLDAHDTITWTGVLKAQLHATDFHVV
jgi:hypothetical protein